jgi:WD40 repeat protein
MISKTSVFIVVCFAFLFPAAGWAQKPELVVATGHWGRVTSLAFSPDGSVLASGSQADSTIRLWELATGRELRTLTGHEFGISSLAFSKDGSLLASASSDRTIKLWEVASGRELRTVTTYNRFAYVVQFSPDGRLLATVGDDSVDLWEIGSWRKIRTIVGSGPHAVAFSPKERLLASAGLTGPFDYAHPDDAKWSIRLWDIDTGQEVRELPRQPYGISTVAFSPDGRVLASGGASLKLWDVTSGLEIRTLNGHTSAVEAVAFSQDGLLATASRDKTVRLWEASTGRAIRTLDGGHDNFDNCIAFSPDGTLLASVSERSTSAVTIWDVKTGQDLGNLMGYDHPFMSVTFQKDGRLRAAAGSNQTLQLWDLVGGGLRTLNGHNDLVDSANFSADGRMLASLSGDGAVKVWDVETGRASPVAPRIDNSNPFVLSPDGRLLATVTGNDKNIVKLWDVASGRELHALSGDAGVIGAVVFSPDGRLLASAGQGSGVTIWDVSTGRDVNKFAAEAGELAFSPDGRMLASSVDDGLVIWDVASGRSLRTLPAHLGEVRALAFSADGRLLASAGSERAIKLWDVTAGRELRTLTAGNDVDFVQFSPDGRFLISLDWTGSIMLWDVQGTELARIVGLNDRDWAVVDPEGRYDASQAGMELMHWTVGVETISLNQLKDRYFDPGLLAKVLGLNKEPLRDVIGFTDVKLFPEVESADAVPGRDGLQIRLRNRGGGIGRVQVFVNGKELQGDARGPGVNPDAVEATLTLDLSGAHWKPGEQNDIRIVCWNREGYLSSRGVSVAWQDSGPPEKAPPELYAIVAGISDYAAPDFRLHFAAKDATDFARALKVAGSRLFGQERVHLSLLSSASDEAGARPTKENLAKAFEAARKSKPGDVLVVYLAGHGVAIHDTYAYPTEEARTLDLADPDIRRQTSVTSEELVTWIKAIPALHQVMILDTCAAGAAQRSLMEKRDLPSDQIRAIDRLKDRTGFFVLMGSAADASSYEASQFGQGLLTYSLLQGMRGAALRDNKFVDVSKLFEYAADEVPQLALNIGGLQRPLIATPEAGASFDIGELEGRDKEAIPLALVKPIILRPVLINPDEGVDNLELMRLLRDRLRDTTYVGTRSSGETPAVFVDEEDFPGAIRPTGTYSVEAGQVKVRLVLTRNGKKIGESQVTGPAQDRDALVERILGAILQGAK